MAVRKLIEFHKFEHRDTAYLYAVNEFKGYRINKELSAAIEALQNSTVIDDAAMDPELKEALEKLGLLVTDQTRAFTQDDIVNALPPVQPINSISLNVAQLCNLSCIYCYGVDGEYGEKGYMKHRTAYDTVDWLIANSGDDRTLSIIFFGGEPLLNFPLIKKVVAYADEKGTEHGKDIRYSMTTNGTMFRPEVNEFLNEHGFSITISFDGDADMQNTNRPFKGGRGSYEVVRKKVAEFLKTRDGKAVGRATITGNNTDLRSVRRQLIDIGFNKVASAQVSVPVNSIFPEEQKANGLSKSDKSPAQGCGTTMSAGNGCSTKKPAAIAADTRDGVVQSFPIKFLDPAEVAVKTAKIVSQTEAQISTEQEQRILEDIEFRMHDFLDRTKRREKLYDLTIYDIVERIHRRKPRVYFCGAGRNYLGVSISGDIYPCHRFVGQKEHKLGNIRDWNDGVREKYVQNFGMGHKKCSTCFARYFCGGGCFHESIETNGRMDEPDDRYCQRMRRELEISLVAYDNLNLFDKVHLGLVKTKLNRKTAGDDDAVMIPVPEDANIEISD